MTFSYTTSESFTKTHAVYLASKTAADLRQMQLFYGRPSDGEIDAYIKELVILLLARCLGMVEYGFIRNGGWVVVTRYVVRSDGFSGADERSGRIPPNVTISGATWHSYLEYNLRWDQLTETERARIQVTLPFQRKPGHEPGIGLGGWVLDKTYSRAGVGLERGVYRAS